MHEQRRLKVGNAHHEFTGHITKYKPGTISLHLAPNYVPQVFGERLPPERKGNRVEDGPHTGVVEL
jgi:hypothetical protein